MTSHPSQKASSHPHAQHPASRDGASADSMAPHPAGHPAAHYSAEDFDHSPFIVFYEVTRACDLACRHCRACAAPKPHPGQLSNDLSRRLIEQFAQFPKPPLLVFTGGDPFKREDLFELIAFARDAGLPVAITPSATPLVTREALTQLKDSGVRRIALSLDGVDAQTHDSFRGFDGSYQRTIEIMKDCRDIGIPRQINTTITQRNLHQVDQIAELIATFDIVLWSVFLLVPVGRGKVEKRISPPDYERLFERLWHHAEHQPFSVKTTEAHHYRRFVLQHEGDPQRDPGERKATADPKPETIGLPLGSGRDRDSDDPIHHAVVHPHHTHHHTQRAPLGVNDGKGVMFVSHAGEVCPSGFMPIVCGRFPEQSVVDIYQNAPLMKQLRDPDSFHGKCGECEYRQVCGGSRARAYAVTGDPLGSEPDCIYTPGRKIREAACSA